MSHLFCFGMGFSASALAGRLCERGWTITGTSRSEAGCAAIAAAGYRSLLFNGRDLLPATAFEGVTHVLSSVPPSAEGDPVLAAHGPQLAAIAGSLEWLGYLSTTGVYGDRQGGWVDETSALEPATERGMRRVAAERDWMARHGEDHLPVHIFRLAGIYGPGRNQLRSVASGKARRIVKPGQVFSRIHVEDIAGILLASIKRPNPGAVYNVCDDEAAPPQDVIAYAAELLGLEPPEEIAFADADLSDMARSFYAESKRVRNDRIKLELGYTLRYPDYRQGLQALLGTV